MKKLGKKLLAVILAALICVSALSFSSYAITYQKKADDTLYVNAQRNTKGGWSNLTKLRMEVCSGYILSSEIYGAARIEVKSSKPAGLKAIISDSYYDDRDNYDAEKNVYKGYSWADIYLYAFKPGTYTVTVTAKLSNGTTKTQKISVLAETQSGPFKSVKLGKKAILSNTGKLKKGELVQQKSVMEKVTAKSGKLKITPNGKYKITGMIVVSVDKKGKASYKKVKNGKNIVLSKGYEYTSKDAKEDGSYKSCKKHTYIYISYKDTFTGDSYTYSVSTKRGKKEVKYVRFEKQTGQKYVSYDASPSFDLWNY